MAIDENPYQSPLTVGERRAKPRRAMGGTPHIGWAVLMSVVGVVIGGITVSPAMPNRGNPHGLFLGGILGLMCYFIVLCVRFIGSKLRSFEASQQSEPDRQD